MVTPSKSESFHEELGLITIFVLSCAILIIAGIRAAGKKKKEEEEEEKEEDTDVENESRWNVYRDLIIRIAFFTTSKDFFILVASLMTSIISLLLLYH